MAGEIRSYRDLETWQRAFELGLAVYEVTKSFPESERFGLISQLRRGGISVASNIAEGYGRGRTADYLRFLTMSRGALYEIDTQLLFAVRLEYIKTETYQNIHSLLEQCGRLLAGLIRSLEQ